MTIVSFVARASEAYAFNEHSVECCDLKASLDALIQLVDRSRAWQLSNSGPLVNAMTKHDEYDDRSRGRHRTRFELLAYLAANDRSQPTVVCQWDGRPAIGFSFALEKQGFAISWPCSCSTWTSGHVALTHPASEGSVCRHVGSIDHLLKHWQVASRQARRTTGRPRSVLRVDNALNPAAGEVPQIHFRDGSALNIDGTWKHGRPRRFTSAERVWLSSVGWVLPDER